MNHFFPSYFKTVSSKKCHITFTIEIIFTFVICESQKCVFIIFHESARHFRPFLKFTFTPEGQNSKSSMFVENFIATHSPQLNVILLPSSKYPSSTDVKLLKMLLITNQVINVNISISVSTKWSCCRYFR